MKCPNCGREIASNSNFCEFCGTKISIVSSNHSQEKEAGRKITLIVSVSLVLVLALLGGVLYYHNEVSRAREELRMAKEKVERESAVRVGEDRKAESGRHPAEAEKAKAEAEKAKAEAERAKAEEVKAKAEAEKARAEKETLESKKRAEEKARKEVLKNKLIQMGYVDLGLPSGTLWMSKNEDRLYNYDEAVEFFGYNIPTRKQKDELFEKCKWTWTGSGFVVVGPNGNQIYLPADQGMKLCDGRMYKVGHRGRYWVLLNKGLYDTGDSAQAFFFTLEDGHSSWGNGWLSNTRCECVSVRLIYNL